MARWYEEHQDKPEDLAKKVAFEEGKAMGQAPASSSGGATPPALGFSSCQFQRRRSHEAQVIAFGYDLGSLPIHSARLCISSST